MCLRIILNWIELELNTFTVCHTRLFVNMFPHKRLKWKTCNFHIIQIEFWWYIKERMQRKYNKVNQQQLLKGFACSISFCFAPETLHDFDAFANYITFQSLFCLYEGDGIDERLYWVCIYLTFSLNIRPIQIKHLCKLILSAGKCECNNKQRHRKEFSYVIYKYFVFLHY